MVAQKLGQSEVSLSTSLDSLFSISEITYRSSYSDADLGYHKAQVIAQNISDLSEVALLFRQPEAQSRSSHLPVACCQSA